MIETCFCDPATPSRSMRRCFGFLLGLLSVCSACLHVPAFAAGDDARAASSVGAKPAPSRPNILLIYTDDQPYKTVSCYPESPRWVKTPHIDKLARGGIRFQRAYCGSWCMPSRASMLTGRLPYAIESMRMEGEYPGSAYDPDKCPFWPSVFRQHGYHTAQIGKWHTGVDTGWGRDWDHQIVWNRPAHPENAGAYYGQQVVDVNGVQRLTEGYSTDNYTRWAEEYVRGQHRDEKKPWFLWLCYGAVHGPTTPAPRHKDIYAGQTAPVPADIFGPRPDKPGYLDVTQAWIPGPDGAPAMKRRAKRKGNFDVDEPGLDFHRWVQQVNACALAIDEGVGRIVAALEETGQLENTLVVFTSDQGYALGEHGFSQKQAPYDATIAAPLIISQPGKLPQNKLCRQPVNVTDLVATFCKVAAIELPWKTHGHDLTPLLNDPEGAVWNVPMLMSHTGQRFGSDTHVIPTGPKLTEPGGVPWWVLLRDGRHKYIRTFVAGAMEEIYDLDKDPEELDNLAVRPEHRQLLESMRARMIDELRRTDAGFVDAMPAVRPPPVKPPPSEKAPG